MVTQNLEISYIIIWSLALANIVGTGTCMLLSNKISKITTIPYGYVAPFMLMIIFFAALQATRSLEDLILLIAIGAIGTLFKYFDWPRPALLIGFVLAGTVETYYYQAVQFYSWEMLERPGVIILIVFMIASILLSVYFKKRDSKKDNLEDTNNDIKYTFFSGELIFTWALMAFALFALIDGYGLRFLGGIFPIVVSSLLLIFGIILTIQLTSKKRQKNVLSVEIMENNQFSSEWKIIWKNFLILPIFLLGTWILGFIPALAILFVSIIRIKMNSSWLKIAIITSCAIAFLLFVSNAMTLHLPTGLIYDMYLKGN
jgi:putative tricarboxylic transport membrane protein